MRRNRHLLRLIVIALVTFSADSLWAAEAFRIDPDNSSANFSIKHMQISTVRGSFHGVSGTIVYDADDPSQSSVEVSIKVATVDTGTPSRDNHLRGADFFDVGKYPEIKFRSTSVRKLADGSLVAHGLLTMKNVSKEIDLPFALSESNQNGHKRIGIESRTTLNRLDYGVSFDSSGITVGKEVAVELNVEAGQAKN